MQAGGRAKRPGAAGGASSGAPRVQKRYVAFTLVGVIAVVSLTMSLAPVFATMALPGQSEGTSEAVSHASSRKSEGGTRGAVQQSQRGGAPQRAERRGGVLLDLGHEVPRVPPKAALPEGHSTGRIRVDKPKPPAAAPKPGGKSGLAPPVKEAPKPEGKSGLAPPVDAVPAQGVSSSSTRVVAEVVEAAGAGQAWASIAHFAASGAWVVERESPGSPHPPLFKRMFNAGDAVPEEGCEAKWGNSWLRAYHASRADVCTPSPSELASYTGTDVPFKRRAGPLAWEETGWRGGVDAEYGVRLGQSQGEVGGPKTAPGRVTRWTATTGSHFEWMRNVAVDFGKKATNGNDHHFEGGFLSVACEQKADFTDLDQGAQPAFRSLHVSGSAVECGSWIHTPTMVLQHEDIGNTYHNLGDFFRAWVGTALLSAPMCVPAGEAEDPTRGHGPKGAARAGDGTGGFDTAPPPCPAGTVRVPGLDPDAMQFMTLDARLMCGTIDVQGRPITQENREDCFGPYFPQYNTWYGQGVVRARDFGAQRVCFSALGFAAITAESHVWDHFGDTNPCGTSPLFRAYSTHTAGRWGVSGAGPRAYRTEECRRRVAEGVRRGGGAGIQAPPTPVSGAPFTFALPTWVLPRTFAEEEAVPGYTRIVAAQARHAGGAPGGGAGGSSGAPPPACSQPYVRVVYVARKTKPFNSQKVLSRVVANEPAFFDAMYDAAAAKGVDLDLIEADFALMGYRDQVLLTRSASLLVGMHGAGLVHGLDLADADECGGSTGVIELFPQGHAEKGVRNMNVQVGRNYWTWRNEDSAAETGSGTNVNKEEVQAVVGTALEHILSQRAVCAPAQVRGR